MGNLPFASDGEREIELLWDALLLGAVVTEPDATEQTEVHRSPRQLQEDVNGEQKHHPSWPVRCRRAECRRRLHH
eukprot:SAG22_NODE_6264_length_877_cov_4.925450_2_plen_75_part_00